MKDQDKTYKEVVNRVKQLKNLYNHIPVYIIISVLYVAFCLGAFDGGRFSQYIPFWSPVCMVVGYGLSLVGYSIYLKHGRFFESYYKQWENRKIEEYLKREEERVSSLDRWE
ncbi:2TM domain-containing protein [Leeuwenhoekiella sp. MAR_2009_132]|uniref:2TM domain-containing protein n=1 Tax=Leeuwenhoekiella sp. MAR_2009_132 TaxID=1392489 RepID=UPI00048B1D4E|nr:2TM domain-containing protein [Leeuwenhoekiella sp. MAR_2009_132]